LLLICKPHVYVRYIISYGICQRENAIGWREEGGARGAGWFRVKCAAHKLHWPCPKALVSRRVPAILIYIVAVLKFNHNKKNAHRSKESKNIACVFLQFSQRTFFTSPHLHPHFSDCYLESAFLSFWQLEMEASQHAKLFTNFLATPTHFISPWKNTRSSACLGLRNAVFHKWEKIKTA